MINEEILDVAQAMDDAGGGSPRPRSCWATRLCLRSRTRSRADVGYWFNYPRSGSLCHHSALISLRERAQSRPHVAPPNHIDELTTVYNDITAELLLDDIHAEPLPGLVATLLLGMRLGHIERYVLPC